MHKVIIDAYCEIVQSLACLINAEASRDLDDDAGVTKNLSDAETRLLNLKNELEDYVNLHKDTNALIYNKVISVEREFEESSKYRSEVGQRITRGLHKK